LSIKNKPQKFTNQRKGEWL